MRGYSASILRCPALDVHNALDVGSNSVKSCISTLTRLLSAGSVCYDYNCRRGEVSERLKELASKASVGGTLPWVQIPPSPPFF
jgi:hypothetical protein